MSLHIDLLLGHNFPDFDNIFTSSGENGKIIEFPLLTSKFTKISMNGVLFSIYNKFIDLDEYENNFGVVYLHPSDFKKFSFFEKAFMWDKMKLTRNNWDFLSDYVYTIKSRDIRLINLCGLEIKENEMHISKLD